MTEQNSGDLNASQSLKVASSGTPFHDETSRHVRTTWWYAWDKFILPDVYTDMPSELKAVREAAAVIDMSPLPKMEITGPDGHKLIDRLMTRDLRALEVGHAMYTPWCNDDGLIVGDGLVFRFEEERFIVSGEASHTWFAAQATDLNVTLRNVSYDWGVLALQGPKSFEVLAAATGQDWNGLKFSKIGKANIDGMEFFVARQGFTGEKGFELWVPKEGGNKVYKRIMEAGQQFGVKPVGEYAVDIARIEAGLILVSADYNGAGPDPRCARVDVLDDLYANPYEAGFGRFVKFDRDFVGRAALERESASSAQGRRFVGLRYDKAHILKLAAENSPTGTALGRVVWASMRALKDGNAVGRASSLTYSPTVGQAISFGFLPEEHASNGSTVEIELKDDGGNILGLTTATVVPLPFVELKRSKA